MIRIMTWLIVLLTVNLSYSQEGIKDIKQAFLNQDYPSVITMSQRCYEADSNNVACLHLLASASSRSGDQANAKKYLHILETKDSANIDIYSQLGSIYEQQQQFPKAIKYYSIVNKMQPDNALYFRKNANLYKNYGDFMMAFSLYGKANKLNPRDVLSLKGLAELAMKNDQMPLADSLIQSALNLDSMNIGMNYILAKSKYKQKQFDSVTMVFHKIRGQVDLNSYYNKMLGYAYLQIDSVELAISKLRLALVDDEESEKLHYYLGTAYEKQDNHEGALEHFEKAAEYAVSPDLDLYHRNVGRLANKEKQYKKAILAYQDAYKYCEDPVILYYLAAAADNYYKDKGIAIKYYNRYLKSSHQHKDYKDYSKKRVRYLKEAKFQGG